MRTGLHARIQIGTVDANPNGRPFIHSGYPTPKSFCLAISKKPSSDRHLRYTDPDAPMKIIFPSHKVRSYHFEQFGRERDAFFRIKESLLGHETYEGKFVAILNGDIIAVGESKSKLAREIYAKFGYKPIYIGKVEREQTIGEMSSPERV